MMTDMPIRLQKLDKAGLSPRDILILYVVKNKPGINGIETAHILNLRSHSCVQTQFRRMIRQELIEDRRLEAKKATSAYYHITSKGEKLLDEIIG